MVQVPDVNPETVSEEKWIAEVRRVFGAYRAGWARHAGAAAETRQVLLFYGTSGHEGLAPRLEALLEQASGCTQGQAGAVFGEILRTALPSALEAELDFRGLARAPGFTGELARRVIEETAPAERTNHWTPLKILRSRLEHLILDQGAEHEDPEGLIATIEALVAEQYRTIHELPWLVGPIVADTVVDIEGLGRPLPGVLREMAREWAELGVAQREGSGSLGVYQEVLDRQRWKFGLGERPDHTWWPFPEAEYGSG